MRTKFSLTYYKFPSREDFPSLGKSGYLYRADDTGAVYQCDGDGSEYRPICGPQLVQDVFEFSGDDAMTTLVCTHNWDTRFVQVQAYDAAYKAVGVDYASTSVNDVTVYLGEALKTGEKIYVVIQGFVEP